MQKIAAEMTEGDILFRNITTICREPPEAAIRADRKVVCGKEHGKEDDKGK